MGDPTDGPPKSVLETADPIESREVTKNKTILTSPTGTGDLACVYPTLRVANLSDKSVPTAIEN